MKTINNMYVNNFNIIPNFFDFIEADSKKIFGGKGAFVVFNIFNLFLLNEKYGNDIGDVCIKVLSESIKNITLEYNNCFRFRFGNNDFIITLPNCTLKEINEVFLKVEEEFNKTMESLGFPLAKLNKFTFEYSNPVDYIEDFYELFFFNVSELEESKETSRRILRHIIGTFTKNIRNTLTSYEEANNLALKDDVSGLSNHKAGKMYLSGLINEFSQNQKGFAVMFIDGDNLKRYNT